MRMARLMLAVLAAFPVGLASCGGGGGDGDIVIAQITHTSSGSSTPALVSDAFSFYLAMNGDLATTVLDDIAVTPADQGSTFTVGPADDAQFAALALRLMNGIDELLDVNAGPAAAAGTLVALESMHLDGVDGGYAGPDLAGYVLTRIQLVVDQLSLTSGGGGSSYSWSVRFVFRGYRP